MKIVCSFGFSLPWCLSVYGIVSVLPFGSKSLNDSYFAFEEDGNFFPCRFFN